MFRIPFDEEQLSALTGQTLVICRNNSGEIDFQRIAEKKITAPCTFRGGHLKVEEGALCIYDFEGLWAKFNSVEFNGVSTYLRGCFVRELSKSGNIQQATLHIKKPMGQTEFGVCISTCQNYAEFTMPKLLKSLVLAKIPAERIVAVMGGHGLDSETTEGNIKLLTRIQSANGFNGLMGVEEKYPYWLLLEDTTETEEDLVDNVREIDIGLEPDIVRASSKSWMGLYSTKFINRVKDKFGEGVENAVMNGLRTCLVVEGEEQVSEPRNIYGKGIRRSTRNMPIGIQKYDAKTLARMP